MRPAPLLAAAAVASGSGLKPVAAAINAGMDVPSAQIPTEDAGLKVEAHDNPASDLVSR